MIIHYLYAALAFWLVAVIFHYIKTGNLKFKKFAFTIKNYYLVVLPVTAGVVVRSLETSSLDPLFLFIVFGISGMMGETLINFWWDKFFGHPLWLYNVKTIYHRYTSWLNFVPWGFGGYLYWESAKYIKQGPYQGIELLSLVIIPVIFLFQLFLFNLFKPTRHFRFHTITIPSLAVFYGPIILFVVLLASVYGPSIYKIFLMFAFVGTFTEYLFGKVCHVMVSKRLWDYTYLSVDRGHFTVLTIPLFAFGGFCLWLAGRVLMNWL